MPQIRLKPGAVISILIAALYAFTKFVISVILPLPVHQLVNPSLRLGLL